MPGLTSLAIAHTTGRQRLYFVVAEQLHSTGPSETSRNSARGDPETALDPRYDDAKIMVWRESDAPLSYNETWVAHTADFITTTSAALVIAPALTEKEHGRFNLALTVGEAVRRVGKSCKLVTYGSTDPLQTGESSAIRQTSTNHTPTSSRPEAPPQRVVVTRQAM